MSVLLITSSAFFHNSKISFSREELNDILGCYALGVSKGNWRDYSINFNKNEANFNIYRFCGSSPDYTLTKYKKIKKNKVSYKLKIGIKQNKNYENIKDLVAFLKRKHFKLI